MVIGQYVARMDVGSGDDGLSDRDGIAERARSHLRHVEIGRDIDVARLEHVEQFFLLDEGIDEADIVFHAKLAGTLHQHFAVRLALVADQIRMGSPHYDVEHIGIGLGDGGHRLDHMTNALVRCEQAERHQHFATLPAEALLQFIRLARRPVGDSVRNDFDAVRGDAIMAPQDFRAPRRHHDDFVGTVKDPPQHGFLRFRRLVENRMERHDQRQVDMADQLEDVRAGLSSENPILMLKPDGFGAALLNSLRRVPETCWVVGGNCPDFRRIFDPGSVVDRIMVESHSRELLAKRVGDMAGEGGDAAFARKGVADQRKVANGCAGQACQPTVLAVIHDNIQVKHYASSFRDTGKAELRTSPPRSQRR